jgi:hypothetical protein
LPIPNCALRECQDVALPQTREHSQRDGDPKLIGHFFQHHSPFVLSPSAIGLERSTRAFHALHAFDRIIFDDAMLPALLASDRNDRHHIVRLSPPVLLGHPISEPCDELIFPPETKAWTERPFHAIHRGHRRDEAP